MPVTGPLREAVNWSGSAPWRTWGGRLSNVGLPRSHLKGWLKQGGPHPGLLILGVHSGARDILISIEYPGLPLRLLVQEPRFESR